MMLPGAPHAGTHRAAANTLMLTRADIAPLMSPVDYANAVEAGFRSLARGAAQAPAPMHIAAPAGSFHAKGALLEAKRRHLAVKINSNFPGNPERSGRPTIQGVIVLFDADDGRVLALLDSIEITLRRTAAASALAARHLARRDAQAIAICGCGEQARAQLAALALELPLRRAYAWDRDPEAAHRFAAQMAAPAGLPIVAVTEMREATLAADVIVTSTTARVPFLGPGDVRSGTFVAAVGADSPEKSELEPGLMRCASVFVDVREQCLAMGDLRHAIAAGAVTPEAVRADLAELVAGRRPGRTGTDEITVFDSTGTALEDVAAAVAVYERARSAGIGTPLALAGAPRSPGGAGDRDAFRCVLS
jgi:ornithine cyclodeaminase/alanine dehydrogenase-like protein (mu-crystallin family)